MEIVIVDKHTHLKHSQTQALLAEHSVAASESECIKVSARVTVPMH